MTSSSFSHRAIDLSGLQGASSAPATSQGGSGSGQPVSGGGFAVEVTEQTFQTEVVDRSASVPVVIDFWATWCQPCKQLSPVLDRLAESYAGRFVLATIDVDQNQRIAQAAGVQSIPFVVGVVAGQVVPLFQGALPEAQLRQYLDELLRVAAENGVNGTADPIGGADQEEESPAGPERDPRYADADGALERGDFEGAVAAFQRLLDEQPGDAEAKIGLTRARLLHRVHDFDLDSVRAAAAERPTDVEAQCAAADLDVVGGHVEDAFSRLIDTLRQVTDADREAVRVHLLELFEVVGADDARVRKARQLLSTALF